MGKKQRFNVYEGVVHQPNHFFSVGNKVVIYEGAYKRASLRDARLGNHIDIIKEVIDNSNFKLKD